jgi:TRAP-type C4-dicarboxylate transport system substrate-binding protein
MLPLCFTTKLVINLTISTTASCHCQSVFCFATLLLLLAKSRVAFDDDDDYDVSYGVNAANSGNAHRPYRATMCRKVWTSLAEEDQAVWDQLSQAAKKTILDHQVERQENKSEQCYEQVPV